MTDFGKVGNKDAAKAGADKPKQAAGDAAPATACASQEAPPPSRPAKRRRADRDDRDDVTTPTSSARGPAAGTSDADGDDAEPEVAARPYGLRPSHARRVPSRYCNPASQPLPAWSEKRSAQEDLDGNPEKRYRCSTEKRSSAPDDGPDAKRWAPAQLACLEYARSFFTSQ